MIKYALASAVLALLLTVTLTYGQDTELFDAPCAQYGVPKQLALAIASKESAMQPWNLNIEGRTVRAGSKKRALTLCRAALDAGLSFDLGVMQVNSQWIRRYNLPLETVLDQPGNIRLGVWILANEIRRHGLTWRAVAAYHTPYTDSDRGRAYAGEILRILRGKDNSEGIAVQTVAATPMATAPILVKRYRIVSENTERILN